MKLWTRFRYATDNHPGWSDACTVTVTEWRFCGVLVWQKVRLHGTNKRAKLRGSSKLPRWQRPLWQRDYLERRSDGRLS